MGPYGAVWREWRAVLRLHLVIFSGTPFASPFVTSYIQSYYRTFIYVPRHDPFLLDQGKLPYTQGAYRTKVCR